jgi:hypothetical protein
MTYVQFFASPTQIDRFRHFNSQTTGREPHYIPSRIPNWEAQHPPLYYYFMAPLMLLTNSLSIPVQLLIMRTVSFLFAVTGWLIGIRATERFLGAKFEHSQIARWGEWYVFIVPMFFPEFARLGNDSLCLLFLGLIWKHLLAWMLDERSKFHPAMIGFWFGLGLSTKAFFLPILGGLVLFLGLRAVCSHDWRQLLLQRAWGIVLLLGLALLLGGGWYIYNHLTYGTIVPEVVLNAPGSRGLLENLRLFASQFAGGNFLVSMQKMVHWLAVIPMTWIWAGTWSLVHPINLAYVPLAAQVGWLLIEYLYELRKKYILSVFWLPVWLVVPVLAGLIYRDVLIFPTGELCSSPGWYLHMLAPAFALAFGLGISRVEKGGLLRRWIFRGLLGYSALSLFFLTWAQTTLFAGCATKDGCAHTYIFPPGFFCLDQIAAIMNRVEVYGWPRAAVILLSVGGVFIIIAAVHDFGSPSRRL